MSLASRFASRSFNEGWSLASRFVCRNFSEGRSFIVID
jgi:hypothetical protein